MLATGTATDPLGVSDSGTLTVSTGGATGVRTIRSSLLANRVNWGNSTTDTTQGPEASPDPFYHAAGPLTLGFTAKAVADSTSRGMRVMKMPAGHGTVTACVWSSDGTLLASKVATWVADDGGWFEFLWDAPVDLAEDESYTWGYHYPTADTNYALSTYVWNNGQDTCVWPLVVTGSTPTFFKAGGSPTFTSLSADRNPHAPYIDPLVEWTTDLPGYVSGEDYFGQFPNGGGRFGFPFIIDFADPQWLDEYKALGFNTLISGGYSQAYRDAVVGADLDWYPSLHDNDLSGVQAVQADSALAACVRGYMLTDEPEFSAATLPATLRTWRNNCRRLDSTRPIYLNVGVNVMYNQGFNWVPAGINATDVNKQWREYLSLVDIGSVDQYGIAHSFPFTYQGANDIHRYGIWVYPMQVRRMRTEITDERVPIWGEVESTSAYPNSPTPTQVLRASWSLLIAGAKGLIFFDHRFANGVVTNDFDDLVQHTDSADITKDAAMDTAVSGLATQIASLSDALLADEAGLIASASGTGTMSAAQGGYPAGVKIPLHYTSRVAGGTTYFFIQSIRDGDAGTVAVDIPGFQDAELTVIGESRTITVDSDGTFTDDFDGDYAYHLYSTTGTPSFSAPVNSVAPAITADGTPETGETVTASSGTWAGSPTPTYAYQWQRNSVDISGATTAAYVLQVDDEDQTLRCVVTATNSQGSASANSGTITPSAPPTDTPSVYSATVLADSPVAYWRLADLTDSSGNGRDLTATSGAVVGLGASVITDADDSSALFATATEILSITDEVALRASTTWSLEAWVNIGPVVANGRIVSKEGCYYLSVNQTTAKINARLWTTGGNFWDIAGDTTLVSNGSYHLVLTYDGSDFKLYVNGVLDGTAAVTAGVPTSTANAVSLGKDVTTGADGWYELMDEVAIYQSTLSSTRVAAHYTDGAA